MQKPALHPWFDVGDVAPVVELRTADGKTKPISRMAGRTAVVHVADGPASAVVILSGRAAAFAAAGADLYAVRRGGAGSIAGPVTAGVTPLTDADGSLARNLNLTGPATVVFDRASRLSAVIPLDGDSATHADACLAWVRERLPTESFLAGPAVQAPVMVIPDVLSADWCRWLIQVHDN